MFRSTCRALRIVLLLSCCVWLQSSTKLAGQLAESFDQTVSPSLVEVLGDLNVDSTFTRTATDKLTIAGQVIDAHGRPSPNALVVCWTKNWKDEYLVLGRTLSNQDGRYAVDASGLRRIANEAEHVDLDKRLEHEMSQMSILYRMLNLRNYEIVGENLNNYPVNVIAVGPNNCMGQAVPQAIFSQSRIDCNIHLNDNAGEVVGKVVDTNGEPVSGVTITMNRLSPDVSQESSVSLIPAQFQTVTASDGKFVFRQLPSDYVAVIRLSNSDHTDRAEWVATSKGASFTKQMMVLPNSSLFRFVQPLTKRVFGKVADLQDAPVEGVAIRIGTHRTTTNGAGEYSLEAVPETERYIQAICPTDGKFATAGAYLDWNACLKGEPQRTIQAHEGVWVTGRVVAPHDRRAISNVSIKAEHLHCGKNNPDGSFRYLVSPAVKQLRLVPAWLTEHEQENAPSYPISLTLKQDLSLGDLPLDIGDELAEIDVRVVLPSDEPAKECIVRLRSANQRGVYANRTLKVNDAWTTAAVADSGGNCRLRPAVHLGSTEYLSVTYPEVDPQYFGEIALAASQTKAEVQLVPVQPIRGKVSFNGQPFSGARLMVRTVGEAPVSFKSFRFEGTSDSSGNYEVLVPKFKSYEISLLQGVHHYGIKDGIGNDPISIVGNDGPMIPGPAIEVLKGTGTISGHVIGTNMRGYSGARINLRPAAGKVVIGFFSQDSNGSDGAFRASGIPEGTFEFFTSNTTPQSKPTPESEIVQAKAGDKDVEIKMIRNSR